MPKIFTVDKDYHDSRLDKWFKKKVIDIPHSLVEKIIRQNKVKVNNKKTKSSYRVQEGDVVNVYEFSKITPQLRNSIIKYKPKKEELGKYDNYIIENNENFLIINKPAGIPVQSGTKSFKNIIDILNDTKYFLNSKPFIVHRIDKETSGLLIIAKNRKFAQLFTSLFRIRKIHKTYLALTYGKVKNSIKTLNDELIYYENKKKFSQNALTHLKVIKSNNDYSFLELKPITGRKHQLRKQLFKLNKPIVGDKKYYIPGKKISKNEDLMLHSYKIKFIINNTKYNFKASYSKSFENFLKKNL